MSYDLWYRYLNKEEFPRPIARAPRLNVFLSPLEGHYTDKNYARQLSYVLYRLQNILNITYKPEEVGSPKRLRINMPWTYIVRLIDNCDLVAKVELV